MNDSNASQSPVDEQRPRRHSWVTVASGRVCSECMKTQAANEFDDTPDCTGPRKPGQ